MPIPKRYASSAARQKAYRHRQKSTQKLAPIPVNTGPARWRALRKNALFMLEALAAEMRDYIDDRSEAWQESDRAQEFEERIELVETAVQAVDEIP